MTRPNLAAVDAWTGLDAPRPLASWYTEGVSDALGNRLLMFDNSGETSLELLRFRSELAAVNGFEDALRDRTAQIHRLSHPAFPQIRAVEYLDGGLALVSTFTPGKRLAEIFRSPRARGGVHPAFAVSLVQDLTSALAELQRQGEGVAHACLTADRIVITPDGHLMIVEHVLGAALDRLRSASSRLWSELGLVPATSDAATRLDGRTDVIQLGWIVLSALVGRRLTSAEYPACAEALLDEFVRAAGPRSPGLVVALGRWLERALQVRGDVFGSASDAHDALFELRVDGARTVAFMPGRPAAGPVAVTAGSVTVSEALEPVLDAETSTMATATDVFGGLRAHPDSGEDTSIDRAAERSSRRATLGWIAAAVFALVAAAEGIALGRLASIPAAVPPPLAVPVAFNSLEPGDAVIVNGKQVGVTPLTLTLTPEVQSIQIQARAAAPASVVPEPATAAVDPATAALLAQAREQRGGLRLISPIEVQVLEGERVLGSSADGPIVTTNGRHELDFVNAAIGYRSHQVVDVRAGRIVSLTVLPPGGRLSINAVPWAQVSIDGKAAGDTPLANLPLPAGEHQITFRHPQLGEQTQKVIVKSDVLTRVSATFAR